MRHSIPSLSRRPVNWMLYGTPSAANPHGRQIAGTRARSIGIVNSALRGGSRPGRMVGSQRSDLQLMCDGPRRIATGRSSHRIDRIE